MADSTAKLQEKETKHSTIQIMISPTSNYYKEHCLYYEHMVSSGSNATELQVDFKLYTLYFLCKSFRKKRTKIKKKPEIERENKIGRCTGLIHLTG